VSNEYNINWVSGDGSVVSSSGTIKNNQFITDPSSFAYLPDDDAIGIAISKDFTDAKIIKQCSYQGVIKLIEPKRDERPPPINFTFVQKGFININLSPWIQNTIKRITNSNIPNADQIPLINDLQTVENSNDSTEKTKSFMAFLCKAKNYALLAKDIATFTKLFI
jgi:hypothetical protein